MATQPMQDPAADPAEGDTSDDGGYVIQIKVDGQGKLSVGVENESGEAPEAAEGAEPAGGGEDEDAEMSDFSPADNIKDALTQALAIYKNNGQAPESGGDDEFESGYANRGGSSAAS